MKADWNLMRQIALAVENSTTAGLPEIAGRSPDEVGYHAHLLIDRGLAEGFSVRNMGHSHPHDFITSLTMTGHEFAELARDEGRWQAAITEAQDAGPVTLPILQNLLSKPRRRQSAPASGKSSQASGPVVQSDPDALSPGREFPRMMHHATEQPRMVSSKQEELSLGPEWSRKYIHQEYPKCKYHWSGKDVTVKTAEEEAALGGGWANTPAAFTSYKGPRKAGEEHHPERWVDEWMVAGLSSDDKKRIKARLWKADSEFWKEPDAPSADTSAMRMAFDLVADVLFSSGILTEQLLRDQIPALVWDSAIAAGWWRLASETPLDMFRERLGHYWVWREEGKDWPGLFRSESAKWRAQLLEHPPAAAVLPPRNAESSDDVVMDTFRTLAGIKAADSDNRAFWLTVEIFPSASSFIPEKLGLAVERIVGEHEGSIREAVIETLRGFRPSGQDQAQPFLIFDAVVKMVAELFNEALDRMGWMDDNNPPEAYDDAADALYQDAIDFVIRKYKSLASEIPGMSPACDPARLDALRTEWLQVREEAKRDVHDLARRVREAQAEAAAKYSGPGTGGGTAPENEKGPSANKPGASSRTARIKPPRAQERLTGSMDRVEMTDPIWRVGSAPKGPVPITRLSGEVDWIDPSGLNEPDDSGLRPEGESRIADVTMNGQSELRRQLEVAFSGPTWPPVGTIIESFRQYSVNVFDVNADAYREAVLRQGKDSNETLNAMARNLLAGVFGGEWENSPGERVIRIDWQDGPEGWKGREIAAFAGNDPDPNCLFHELVGDAIKHRYRFHAPAPPPVPGEPPAFGVSNLEWWQYIGLKERHNLAMAVKPYLEDRVAHWFVIYGPPSTAQSEGNGGTGRTEVPIQPTSAVRTSPTDAVAMDSRIKIKFEAGLALAEVTLAQDLKDHGPSIEIAQKYVTAATLTLARCLLTPNCADPYEAIQRTYRFAEWFAGEAIKPAWVWICVFSAMSASGKLEKYKRDRVTEDGKAERMSESEIQAWHACLFEVAHEALDEFVPEFWKDRLRYFSEHPDEESASKSVESAPTRLDGGTNAVAGQSRDAEIQQGASPIAASSDKGNLAILRNGNGQQKIAVTVQTASRFGGVTIRSIERAITRGTLKATGSTGNRRVKVASLLECFPPEDSAT